MSTGLLQDWKLQGQDSDQALQWPAALSSTSAEALICAAMQGMGIAYLPDFALREALAAGTLRSVLDQHMCDGGSFSILWPSSRHLLPKLRVFVDFLAERLVLGP